MRKGEQSSDNLGAGDVSEMGEGQYNTAGEFG